MERSGDLRIAPDPRYAQPPDELQAARSRHWHEERVLPQLRAMLDLPFERVIISHGAPVHDRAAFERALDLPPCINEST
jgi:hypothetical protein